MAEEAESGPSSSFLCVVNLFLIECQRAPLRLTSVRSAPEVCTVFHPDARTGGVSRICVTKCLVVEYSVYDGNCQWAEG